MSLDDLALFLQRLMDRFVRWVRLGARPARGGRRLLIVQIDGLPRSVLERGLREGRMPFLARLVERRGFGLLPMTVGLPTSTPAFQLSAMYGVRPDIPGFHYHDKGHRRDVYFPRAGDASFVEAAQTGGRPGILLGGSAYGCVFTGGAQNNLYNFATITRPTGAGLARALAAVVILSWVTLKCVALSAFELTRAAARLVADPVNDPARRFKMLMIKLGLSVWVRELFTLAVSRDLYLGVPAIYVNYLDYDVMAHAYGPRHRRARRALRRIDRSIHQLWRVIRRVPEHGYDLYVLSDHGQTSTVPYPTLTGGRPIERLLFDEFFDGGRARSALEGARGHRLMQELRALRAQRRHGLVQRFLNYLERDFLSRLTEPRETHERDGVRVISAGPNAFVYFLDEPAALAIERIDERHPGLAEDISRSRGIGFVLARSAQGPVCSWRGKRYALHELGDGPFAGRADLAIVTDGIRDLMAMPSAGDLVIYGHGAPEGDVSFIPERGAHAGPSAEELQTFVLHPPNVRLPEPLVHPVQLYDHFIRYHA
ncbi:MAG: hypothetical protein DMD81_23075 [Candidatus Rokuibacteriota bacterium]|nr:MAG: hypothetical protein DMD81_23075 [Candidatus Rokubacteria bacterium]